MNYRFKPGRIIIILLLVFVFFEFYSSLSSQEFSVDTSSKSYFVNNAYKETGSKNFVTAIYLDYRLFDSLFEASILLITVSGITFISKKNE